MRQVAAARLQVGQTPGMQFGAISIEHMIHNVECFLCAFLAVTHVFFKLLATPE